MICSPIAPTGLPTEIQELELCLNKQNHRCMRKQRIYLCPALSFAFWVFCVFLASVIIWGGGAVSGGQKVLEYPEISIHGIKITILLYYIILYLLYFIVSCNYSHCLIYTREFMIGI